MNPNGRHTPPVSDPLQHPVHDPMLDPVVDSVLDPVADPPLDPGSDPSAMPAGDPRDADPFVIAAVVDVRNRFGVSGLEQMVELARAEIVLARQALQELVADR